MAASVDLKSGISIVVHEKGWIVGWLFDSKEAGVGMVEAISDLADKWMQAHGQPNEPR